VLLVECSAVSGASAYSGCNVVAGATRTWLKSRDFKGGSWAPVVCSLVCQGPFSSSTGLNNQQAAADVDRVLILKIIEAEIVLNVPSKFERGRNTEF
jgi:hypothetical protein